MILQRRIISDTLTNPNFCQQVLQKCLRTKSSHGYGEVWGKNKAEDEGEHKIHLLKSRGQHLLTNPRVLDAIIRVSNIESNDTVLEIGPGTGNLTLKLLEAAKNVVAVEIDKRMIEILQTRAAGFPDRLKIINGDALKIDFPEFNLVVANIPYGISSPLLAKLVYGVKTNPFRSATLLLQKEFARRLLAKPGDTEFNRLAVNMNLVAEVEFVMNVSKRDFVPCPKVDSSVVKIYPKSEIPVVDLDEWWAFTRTCFCKKNKTLGATFKHKKKVMELINFSEDVAFSEGSRSMRCHDTVGDEGSSSIGLFRTKILSIMASGGFLDKRPSKLSNDDLLHLLSLFNEAGIFFHNRGLPNDACDAGDFDDML